MSGSERPQAMPAMDSNDEVPDLKAESRWKRGLQTVQSHFHWFRDLEFDDLQTMRPEKAQLLTLDAINDGTNDIVVLLVAATGFFADSYTLFATNAILPMLDYVYSGSSPNPGWQAEINLVTLAGCFVGMISFGYLGDKYGRRKLYGFVLLMLMGGTLGLVMSSSGYIPVDRLLKTPASPIDWTKVGSMNVISWLVFWRFVSGVGIGGDYPLSAVMVSELAPTSRRARMLAILFSMQAFGYAAATLMTMIVVSVVQSKNKESTQLAVDQIWRWVMGLSLIPASIAALMRCFVPESPRFTLYVLNHPFRALQEADTLTKAGVQDKYKKERVDRAIANYRRGHEQSGTSSPPEDDSEPERTKGSHPRKPDPITLRSFWRYLENPVNARNLAVTATTWFLLDFTFFGLGFNSPQTMSKVWEGQFPRNNGTSVPTWDTDWKNSNPNIYSILQQDSRRSLLTSSIGAIVGAILLILAIERWNRRKLQYISFAVIAGLFIIIGATYQKTIYNDYRGVTITLYAFTQLCFYFGPNALTFIIAAELFPTKFRCTCHGISAAAGKLGSIIVQIFLSYASFPCHPSGECHVQNPDSTWLGWIILIFAIPMLLGCAITWIWLPEVQEKDGPRRYENITLEDLAGEQKPARTVDIPLQNIGHAL